MSWIGKRAAFSTRVPPIWHRQASHRAGGPLPGETPGWEPRGLSG